MQAKSFVYTNVHSGFRRIFLEVEAQCSIDHLFFDFRNSLAMKQVLRPGWHHDLNMEVVAEGVVDLSPGWSEAEPWVLFICDPLRAAEGSERVSSNVGVSPGAGLLRSS